MYHKNKTQPHYLCIGHFCHDVRKGKNILGGTASYASIAAQKLGVKTAVLTSVGNDFEFKSIFKKQNIEVCYKIAAKTTVFENIYDTQGKRTQYLHARADVLFPKDVPSEWLETHIVQFCMIDDEVDFSLLKHFPNALIGATIQGWLRQWDASGKISPKAMDWRQLAAADVVIMSDADISSFETAIPIIASHVKVLVMTQGANGATVFHNNQQFYFPSYPIKEVDATGAGDVFAAAFLIKYAETKDIALATAFAHAAASFVVEGVGIKKLTAIETINERFEKYKAIYFI